MEGLAPSHGPGTPRILIVDDEPGLTRLLARILRKTYTVTEESDPRVAVARMTQGERYDLVLCDLMMTPLGGLDVYDAVVRSAPHMATRFMLMTGGTIDAVLERRLAVWRHGVLYKPFNVADVIALVAGKLERLRGLPMQHENTLA